MGVLVYPLPLMMNIAFFPLVPFIYFLFIAASLLADWMAPNEDRPPFDVFDPFTMAEDGDNGLFFKRYVLMVTLLLVTFPIWLILTLLMFVWFVLIFIPLMIYLCVLCGLAFAPAEVRYKANPVLVFRTGRHIFILYFPIGSSRDVFRYTTSVGVCQRRKAVGMDQANQVGKLGLEARYANYGPFDVPERTWVNITLLPEMHPPSKPEPGPMRSVDDLGGLGKAGRVVAAAEKANTALGHATSAADIGGVIVG